ncbi:MAG: hypothetical protein LQ352_007223 [Teloschistes flavicans]|nr:MAG: hypothetical protein LQ352_007223 [Teloschistes flavicans]
MVTNLDMEIPSDLEQQALQTFDKLLEKGEILFEIPRTDIAIVNGIQYHFSTTSVLGPKPVLSPTDPARSKAVGPFVNPPDEFILARFGNTHTLIMNKYCVYRPMLILHTTLFEPQTDDLNHRDLALAWVLLKAFKTPQMVIYNCGVESGSSQGHKHLQIFPQQDCPGFAMWPGNAASTNEITTNISGMPFTHFVVRLSDDASADYVFQQYERLLKETKKAFQAAGGGTDYNLILVPEWLALVPRRSKGRGEVMFNAANIAGLMWTKDDDFKERIMRMLPGGLAELGIPKG